MHNVSMEEDAELICVELRDCLSRVGSVLARAEDALRKFQVVPVVPAVPLLHELQVGSVDETKGCLYGDFSPRARSCLSSLQELSFISGSEVITEVVVPDQQLMPEMKERCGEPLVVLPSKMCSLDALAVPMMSSSPLAERCQLPTSMDCGGLDGALAPNSETLFTNELCGLLVRLETAYPGSSKEIACILSEKATGEKVKKVKEYLRSKSKKSAASSKVSATA
jgi:hypothetical protein